VASPAVAPEGLAVRPLTAAIGAEITGVDLGAPPDAATVAAIRAALLEHLVLFFRDQHIDDEQHLAFAHAFGPLSISPVATRYQDTPTVTVLDQVSPKGEGADEWHSDNTFMPRPPMGSILRAAQLPPVGGDTCFASMYAAYEGLSPAMRSLVDGLRAVHDITKPLRKAIAAGHSALDLADMQQRWPPVEHPVAATHPETGRKALFVNRNSTTHIVGLTERENDLLLPFLLDHVRSPDFQCRFHWEVGSVAFWDNRSVQHFAVADYAERRVMRRVTIDGPPIQ
jgi:taurine dioxygenase